MTYTKITEIVDTPFTVEVHERLLGRPAVKHKDNVHMWVIDAGSRGYVAVILDVKGPTTEKTVIKTHDTGFLLGELAKVCRAPQVVAHVA